jgi:hypothetical protein
MPYIFPDIPGGKIDRLVFIFQLPSPNAALLIIIRAGIIRENNSIQALLLSWSKRPFNW